MTTTKTKIKTTLLIFALGISGALCYPFFSRSRLIPFAFLFFYLFSATISFGDLLESVKKESFVAFQKKIISNNLLPDNLSLSYECEEFRDETLVAKKVQK